MGHKMSNWDLTPTFLTLNPKKWGAKKSLMFFKDSHWNSCEIHIHIIHIHVRKPVTRNSSQRSSWAVERNQLLWEKDTIILIKIFFLKNHIIFDAYLSFYLVTMLNTKQTLITIIIGDAGPVFIFHRDFWDSAICLRAHGL